MRSLKPLFIGSAIVALVAWAGLSQSQVIPQPGPPVPIGGAYNTSPPTLTNGQAGWVQVDSLGRILVNVASGGGTGGTSSTFGAAFPGTGTAVGFSDGTNMVAGLVDGSGNIKINCATGCGSGTFNNNADNVATSSTNGQAAAWNYVWDGSAWDRLYGDSTNGAFVNVKTAVLPTGASSAANQATEIASLATIATNTGAAIPAGSALIGKVGIDQTTPGTTNGVQVNAALPAGTNTVGTVGQLPYPIGAIPITASATGTTGATTATLAGTSGKTTYICWSSVRANATAAATVTNTITGVVTGTLSAIMWVAPAASGLGIDEMIYNPCVPASATNTGIAIVSGAPGTGGNVSVKGGGYQL